VRREQVERARGRRRDEERDERRGERDGGQTNAHGGRRGTRKKVRRLSDTSWLFKAASSTPRKLFFFPALFQSKARELAATPTPHRHHGYRL
jgi:hypothetical protein